MNDTPEENKAAQHIKEMHEFIAENQRLIVADHMRDVERELAAAIEQRDEMRLALRDLTDAFADYGGPTYANVYKNALIALGWTAATGECETRAMSSAAAIRAMKECKK